MTIWRQGELIELDITDLTDTGDGVGKWPDEDGQNRVVFVPDTVPAIACL